MAGRPGVREPERHGYYTALTYTARTGPHR
jgi:hypothetical protein